MRLFAGLEMFLFEISHFDQYFREIMAMEGNARGPSAKNIQISQDKSRSSATLPPVEFSRWDIVSSFCLRRSLEYSIKKKEKRRNLRVEHGKIKAAALPSSGVIIPEEKWRNLWRLHRFPFFFFISAILLSWRI